MIAKITESTTGPSPVTLINPQDNGTSFQFQFVSQAGFSHTILYRTNLVLGSWQTSFKCHRRRHVENRQPAAVSIQPRQTRLYPRHHAVTGATSETLCRKRG